MPEYGIVAVVSGVLFGLLRGLYEGTDQPVRDGLLFALLVVVGSLVIDRLPRRRGDG